MEGRYGASKATLRAKESSAKIDKHSEGADKPRFNFGPDARADLRGLSGIALYESRDLIMGRQAGHIGILQRVREQIRGTATVLRVDSDYGQIVSRNLTS